MYKRDYVLFNYFIYWTDIKSRVRNFHLNERKLCLLKSVRKFDLFFIIFLSFVQIIYQLEVI